MARSSVYRRQGLQAVEQEAKTQEAIEGIRASKYASVALACRELKLEHSYHSVYRRLHGKTKPRMHAHKSQQLLTPVQEKVLQNWAHWLGTNLREDDRHIELFVSKRVREKRAQHVSIEENDAPALEQPRYHLMTLKRTTNDDVPVPGPSRSSRHHFGVITNTPPICQDARFDDSATYVPNSEFDLFNVEEES